MQPGGKSWWVDWAGRGIMTLSALPPPRTSPFEYSLHAALCYEDLASSEKCLHAGRGNHLLEIHPPTQDTV